MNPFVDDAPDLSGLIELSRLEHLDLKPVILRVQTDLFLSAHAYDRRTLSSFEALAGGLIPIVDDETVEIVARKLAPFAETPQSVLAALAARGGASRDIVVAEAARLTQDVIDAALSDGADIGPAIAARADIGRATVREMAARENGRIDLALATNHAIALQGDALAQIVGRARAQPDLARALLARLDLAPGDLAPLFLHADEASREAIGLAVAAVAGLRPCPPAPREAGTILTGFSARGDVSGLMGALGEMLGLRKGFLAAAPDASLRYDLLTLALRAAGLHEEEAVYVFLTLNETVARSVDRVFELVKLFRITARPTARDLLAAILDRPLSERAVGSEAHQPYLAPDARPRMTGAVAAATERAPMRPALPTRIRRTS